MSRGSIGGVTVGNGWMRNNPDLVYPDGHENMDDKTLEAALSVRTDAELKPFQVGENDIVVAYNSKEALEVLADNADYSKADMADFDIEDMSNRLDMELLDEAGKYEGTLGEWVARLNEPQYLFGWE